MVGIFALYVSLRFIIKCAVRCCLCSPAPSSAPQNVRAANASSTEIKVEWQNVVERDRNGIIAGFKVFYRAVGPFAVHTTERVKEIGDGSAVQTVLGGLEEYIMYNISVLAFTSKGDGPNSTKVTARTDQDGKTILWLFVDSI